MGAPMITESPARGDGRAGPQPPTTCPSLLGDTHGELAKASPPSCLADLHLDEVIAAAAPGAFQRNVWHSPLADERIVEHRQEVVRDLRRTGVRRAAEGFATAVESARTAITARAQAHYPVPAELNLLTAIGRFTTAVEAFSSGLAEQSPQSGALRGVAAHLDGYVRGAGFRELADGADALLADLRGTPVELGIQAGTVWVAEDGGRAAWAPQIASFFARFASQADATAVPARPKRYLNHVEAQTIGLIANLRPEVFEATHRFAAAHADFLPADLARLAEELRFFLGFLALVDRLSGDGVEWCVPRLVRGGAGPVALHGVVDLALALKPRTDVPATVPNDLVLGGDERVVFITGPNQGGKTTLARAIGQLAYLTSLGLPVPARSASLPLANPVLTHFPHPDDPEHERGGLAEEMVRLRGVVDALGPSALVVLNELFSATSVEDALELSEVVLPRLVASGCRVVWVTFLEELVTSVDRAVSLVGQVAADDPTRPTFRFRSQPPDGRSHAAALAARHGLSSDDLARRLS